MARQAFQPQRHRHQIFQLVVGIDRRLELWRFLQRIFQLDTERRRNHFRDAIDFGVRNVHRAANILDRRFRRHRAKRNDLRDVLAAIFLRDVINQLAAAAHAKIDVDIRHGNAFRIQEAFEKKVVLQRIHVCNP